MRGQLGLDLAGSAECRLIKCAEILADRTRRICWFDACGVPFFLRRRVLLVRIDVNQAGINSHALTADKTFLDAARDCRLEQVTQQLTLAETSVPVLEKVERSGTRSLRSRRQNQR